MLKVGFIIPYFGKFPKYFDLFLKSCSKNPEYDWLIFTDIDDNYDYPNNVHLIHMTFDNLKRLFQSKFDFTIKLSNPYKLCDYKPAYGFLLTEYLKDYDYWGYCDVDLLFGNLSLFLSENKIREYDKIGHLGHLTLYRNSDDINKLFMSKINGILRYKEVYSTDFICIFDEWNGISINNLFREYGKRIYYFNDFMDIFPYDENLKRVIRNVSEKGDVADNNIVEQANCVVSWENGNVYQWFWKQGKWNKIERAYLHFQKRDMQMLCNKDDNNILGVPNNFIKFENGKIPSIYILKGYFMAIWNIKRIKWLWGKCLYWIIEKTGPIRHKFRLYRSKS